MKSYADVPHGTILKLYCDLLVKWQKSINLVSNSTIPEIWERHFLDSLSILPLIPSNTKSIIDLGSGAGFPGLVVCITSGISTTLVESDGKKCEFLREVIRRTHANGKVARTRIKNFDEHKADLVLSRALAPLTDLLAYTEPLLLTGGCALFHKGSKLQIEIAEAEKKWQFEYEIFQAKNSLDGKIIKIWNINDKGIRDR